MITINPNAADVITININDADQIQLNTTAIVIAGDGASVAWGDITGTLSNQTDLQDALDLKLDSADYNDRFLGLYASVFDLETARPTAAAGDYAQVDFGIGVDVIVYAWDVSDARWIPVGSSAIANTDALPEGSSNLYHTGQRVRDTPLTGLFTASATPITAADSVLSAAGKLQAQISATAAKADAALAAIDAFNPANLSDAGTLLPNDQLVIWRDGVMLRTTVAAFGGGSEPTPTQLMLIPTGATESTDGEYQRFAYDGSHTRSIDVGGGNTIQLPLFYATFPPANRQHDLQVDIKMPSGADNSSVGLFFAVDASVSDMLSGSSKNNLLLDITPSSGATSLLLTNQDDADNPVRSTLTPSPTVGSVISLTTSATTVDLLWDGGSHSMNLPIGFFASAPNLLVMSFAQGNSPIVPLSIKVYEA